jgi:hypothetical protein
MNIPDDTALAAMDDANLEALKVAYGVRATRKSDAIKALSQLRPVGRRKRPRAQERKEEVKGERVANSVALDPPKAREGKKARGEKAKGKKGGTGDKKKKTRTTKKNKADVEKALDEQDRKVLAQLKMSEEDADADTDDSDDEDEGVEESKEETQRQAGRQCHRCKGVWEAGFPCCPDCGWSLIARQCTKCNKTDEVGGPCCCWCGSTFSTTSQIQPPTHQTPTQPVTLAAQQGALTAKIDPGNQDLTTTRLGKGGEATLAIKGNPLSIVFPKVVEAIKGAKFVELKELVPLEITRTAPTTIQLSDGCHTPKSQLVIIEQHLIQSLPEWVNAFTKLISIAREIGFGAVADAWVDHLEAVMDQAKAHDWLTCASYDAVLRRTRAGNGSNNFDWNQRIWDATRDRRAAAGLMKGGKSYPNHGPNGGNYNQSSNHKTTKEATCNGFNSLKGCTRNPCKYKHACSKCQKDHPAFSCAPA